MPFSFLLTLILSATILHSLSFGKFAKEYESVLPVLLISCYNLCYITVHKFYKKCLIRIQFCEVNVWNI